MFFSSPSLLGVDIGAGGIKLVELHARKHRPVLFTYGLIREKYDVHELAPKPQDIDSSKIEAYADRIKRLCQASKVKSRRAVASLPVSSVFHAIVTLPKTDKPEETRSMIRSEVKRFIPRPLEEMALDYQPLNAADKTATVQKILINAVPNQLISFYTKVFARSGLKLEALEPESAALSRSLIGRDGAVSMIIDIGAERTNFFIIENSLPIIHQSVDFGGNKVDSILRNVLAVDSDEMIEQYKKEIFCGFDSLSRADNGLSEKLKEIFRPVIEPILKEIDINLEIFLRQDGNAGKRPEKIVLTGGTAFLPGIAGIISETFKTKCYIGDPWARIIYQQSLKPVLMEIGPQMSVAIGLALRNMV